MNFADAMFAELSGWCKEKDGLRYIFDIGKGRALVLRSEMRIPTKSNHAAQAQDAMTIQAAVLLKVAVVNVCVATQLRGQCANGVRHEQTALTARRSGKSIV